MIEYLAILIPFIGAILGAEGGSEDGSKMFRRLGIAILLTAFAMFKTESFWTITIMSIMGALSIGYGLPGVEDEGSALGSFWAQFFSNHDVTNMFTRGTIALAIVVSLISIPLIKHNWKTYIFVSLGIILVNALISWRSWGTYEFFGDTLSWVETINWGLIAALITIIILL